MAVSLYTEPIMQTHSVEVLKCDWFYQVYPEFLDQGMVILLFFIFLFLYVAVVEQGILCEFEVKGNIQYWNYMDSR